MKRTAVPSATRRALRLRAGEKCEHCGSTDRLSIHHLTAVVHGGGHELENLKLLCERCHGGANLKNNSAGRPKTGHQFTERLMVYMGTQGLERLRKLSERWQVSQAEVIRRLVDAAAEREGVE